MLKIKLARFGKRNQPHYRIVINEAKDKRDGSYVEMIGHYIPTSEPKVLELDLERYNYWVGQGAQPTETVAFLFKIAKSGKGFPPKKKKPSKKSQKPKEKETVAEEKAADKAEQKSEEKADKVDEKADEKADQKSDEKADKVESQEKDEKKEEKKDSSEKSTKKETDKK